MALDYGSLSILIMLVLTLFAVLSTYLEHKEIHVFNEATVAILIGSVAGLILLFTSNFAHFTFSKDIFFFVLLPIIVFNEGYSMNKHHFFKNFFYVILYGVIATFFNFILVTLFSLLLVDAGRNIHPGGNLSELSTYSVIFYAACISSKDSGLVLTLLNFKKRPKLYSILFGEQILNDLIVFSLQKAVNQTYKEPQFVEGQEIFANWKAYLLLLGIIVLQIIVSLLVGLIVGLAFTWITKQFRFITQHGSICTALTIYSGYLAFAICENWEFSGVVSVLLCGALLSHYLTYNLSKTGSHNSKVHDQVDGVHLRIIHLHLPWLCIAGLLERPQLKADIRDIHALVDPGNRAAVQVTVHAHVSLDCSYVEFFFYTQSCRLKTRGHWRINRYEFAIIFFSGLIRGPVAYALIQNFNPQGGLTSQVVMESTTIFLIVLTTLVIGGLLKYFLDWSFYAIEQNPTYTMDHPSIRESVLRNTLTQQEADLKMYKQFTSKSQSIFQRIDENFLKPTLIYNYKHRREDILEAKRQQKKKSQQERQSMLEESMFDDSVKNNRIKKQQEDLNKALLEGRLTGSIDYTRKVTTEIGSIQVQLANSLATVDEGQDSDSFQ